MRHLRELAEVVRSWAANEDQVRALLWYGTQAIGNFTPFSDIDAVIVHRGHASEVVESLRQQLGARVRECVHVSGRGEAALWVDESLTKIDLRMVADPHELHDMATSVDVPAPRFVAVLDKDSACGDLFRLASQRGNGNPAVLVNSEIEKFLIGFEAASNAHRRSDGYRFYFEYNLALHRLARLVELARGNGEYLFLPRMLLSGRLSSQEQIEFRDLHGVLYLPKAQEQKRKLVGAFLKIVRELDQRFPLRRSVDSMASFLVAVLNRDLFFNVRDFADAFDGRVTRGRLFRGSTLSRWTVTPELSDWITRCQVVKVIDFRDPEEAAAHLPYTGEIAERLGVVSSPLSGRPSAVGAPAMTSLGATYFQMFRTYIVNVIAALRIVAEPRNGSVVVHCHAGKDRTGWFCATVGLLLGLNIDRIVDDYLRSGQDTREDSMRDFLGLVSATGGARALLAESGYGSAEVDILRSRLLATSGE